MLRFLLGARCAGVPFPGVFGRRVTLAVAAACIASAAALEAADQPPPARRPAKAAAEKPSWPTFDEVTRALDAQLARLKTPRKYESRNAYHYQPGDILTPADVKPVFDELEKMGWKVSDRQEIEGDMLPDNDWLIRELRRTPDGRRFMNRVGRVQHGYDRLDHFARLDRAEAMLEGLIYNPAGYQLFEYMANPNPPPVAPDIHIESGGSNMGRMLNGAPHGKNFNRPTGRVYTADELLARLKSSYAAAVQARLGGSPPAHQHGSFSAPRRGPSHAASAGGSAGGEQPPRSSFNKQRVPPPTPRRPR